MRRLVVFLLFSQIICAQTDIINSPVLISSSGGEWIADNYNLCFSLGEIAIETYTQESIILTQGFHQESNYQITALNPIKDDYQITVYPNPTPDILYLSSDLDQYVDINIKDGKGALVSSQPNIKISKHYSFDLTSLSSGCYFLEISTNKNQKQVYQIQKFN